MVLLSINFRVSFNTFIIIIIIIVEPMQLIRSKF